MADIEREIGELDEIGSWEEELAKELQFKIAAHIDAAIITQDSIATDLRPETDNLFVIAEEGQIMIPLKALPLAHLMLAGLLTQQLSAMDRVELVSDDWTRATDKFPFIQMETHEPGGQTELPGMS